MADGAVGLRLDQGRPAAGPRPLDRLLGHLMDGEHVVAVDGDAGNAVGRRLGGDIGVERRHADRRRRGVEVVLADEDGGRLLHAGEVDRLVEAGVVDRAVAEEGDADAAGLAEQGADADARGVADAGADDAVGAEQADRAVVEMHGAAAAAATSVALAE